MQLAIHATRKSHVNHVACSREAWVGKVRGVVRADLEEKKESPNHLHNIAVEDLGQSITPPPPALNLRSQNTHHTRRRTLFQNGRAESRSL